MLVKYYNRSTFIIAMEKNIGKLTYWLTRRANNKNVIV